MNSIKAEILESSFFQKFVTVFSFLSNKWYFDVIYNRLINYNILHFSYEVTFKTIDKGVLEIVGPFGL
jgi:hypothetical protein